MDLNKMRQLTDVELNAEPSLLARGAWIEKFQNRYRYWIVQSRSSQEERGLKMIIHITHHKVVLVAPRKRSVD